MQQEQFFRAWIYKMLQLSYKINRSKDSLWSLQYRFLVSSFGYLNGQQTLRYFTHADSADKEDIAHWMHNVHALYSEVKKNLGRELRLREN
jgi:hypothetical protein